MQRITITLTDDLAAELDRFMADSRARNRSEAIRDLVRRALLNRPDAPEAAPCLGVLSFTADHSLRNLGARLAQGRLDRHDQTLAALSVPLDHQTSLEVAVMRGKLHDIRSLAEALFLERGVMHGHAALIPVVEDGPHHAHDHGDDHGIPHQHIRVQNSF